MVGKECEGKSVAGEIRLLRFLGGSESSGVFLAVQPGGEPARVAVRLVLAEPGNAPAWVERWNAAARLSHPHLIRVLRHGRDHLGGVEYLYAVMEYAEENLAQVLPDRPLTADEARAALLPVLGALEYLHAQGFVHGRLKPANILAGNDQVKLSCDSLKPVGQPPPPSFRRGPYDPPEAGRAGASPAADVWSLGVTLVEALTQRLPEWREGQEPPVLPRRLPEPFGEIAYRTLVVDPARRWTVTDVAACMGGVAEAAPAGVSSRRRVPWVLIGAGLAAIAAFGGYRLLYRSPREEQSAPVAEAPPFQAAPGAQPRPSPAGRSAQPAPAVAAPQEPAAEIAASSEGIVTQVLPDVPRAAQDTIQGSFGVEIRVTVDAAGEVTDAALYSPGPSRYFAALALDAARQWKFAPLPPEGGPGERAWLLRFRFDRFSTRVTPSPAEP